MIRGGWCDFFYKNSSFVALKIDSARLMWLGVAALVFLKLLLISGSGVQMIYSPHDDGLYVSRAFHLLMDGTLGSYDARLLVKLPGISVWLAGNRWLGIPYLLSTNLHFAFAGIYFIAALNRLNVNRLLLVFVFCLYLFNPVTVDPQWFRVMREPLSISLLVMMLASILFIFAYLKEQRLASTHIAILAVTFAFALTVREEDLLLYALIAMAVSLALWKYWPTFRNQKWLKRVGVLSLICLPFIMAAIGNIAMRSYVDRHYGAPLLHDFGEGEFPRLIAAIRSVESRKDNRHVMITQEALGKIRVLVPMFAPVIDRLPAPSETSYSCARFKVCSEWTNGWHMFWIKDAAFAAGLTPTLPAGQAYFRNVRLEIERACQEGKLKCRDKGQSLFPTFELRWTRALLQEMSGVFKMMTMPGLGVVVPPPATYPVHIDFGRMYQMVTMSHHYDSQLQYNNQDKAWKNQPQDIYLGLKYWLRYPNIATNQVFGAKAGGVQYNNQDEAWKNQPQDIYLGLKYWLRYPNIATNQVFGAKAGGETLGAQVHYERHGKDEGYIWKEASADTNQVFGAKAGGEILGAQVHYERHGKDEGYIWKEASADQISSFVSPLGSWKTINLKLYEKIGLALQILGAAAFFLRLCFWRKVPLGPVMWVALIFTFFTGVRLLALSYISVYGGSLDVRLFFSTYVVMILLAPLIIADFLVVMMAHRGWLYSFRSILKRNSDA
jgi:hypothetical protein